MKSYLFLATLFHLALSVTIPRQIEIEKSTNSYIQDGESLETTFTGKFTEAFEGDIDLRELEIHIRYTNDIIVKMRGQDDGTFQKLVMDPDYATLVNASVANEVAREFALSITLADRTIADDGKTISVEFQYLTQIAKANRKIFIYKIPTVTFNMVAYNDTIDQITENATEIAMCIVENAFPAIETAQFVLGDQFYPEQDLSDFGNTSLIVVPSDLSPGQDYHGKNMYCQVSIIASDGSLIEDLKSEQNVFEMTYLPTEVHIDVTGDRDHGWVAKGKSVAIQCSANGNPTPLISLKKNGAVIKSEESVDTTSVVDATSSFECSVDSVGLTSTKHEYQVYYMEGVPAFDNSTTTLELTENVGSIDFSCLDNIVANPPVEVELRKDGVKVSQDALKGIITLDMAGTYTCLATYRFDSVGRESEPLVITVIEAPEESAGSGTTIAVIVVLLIIILLVAGGLFWFLKKKKEKEGEDGTELEGQPAEHEELNPDKATTGPAPTSSDSEDQN